MPSYKVPTCDFTIESTTTTTNFQAPPPAAPAFLRPHPMMFKTLDDAKKLYDEQCAEVERLTNTLIDARKETRERDERIEKLIKERDQSTTAEERIGQQLESSEKLCKSLAKDKATIEESKKDLEERMREVERNATDSVKLAKSATEEQVKAEIIAGALDVDLEELQENCAALEAERDELQKKFKILDEDYSLLKEQHDDIKMHYDGAIEELGNRSNELLRMDDELELMHKELEATIEFPVSTITGVLTSQETEPTSPKVESHFTQTLQISQPTISSSETHIAQPTMVSMGTQTDGPFLVSQAIQAIQPAMDSAVIQTDGPSQVSQATQTDQPTMDSIGMQTIPMYQVSQAKTTLPTAQTTLKATQTETWTVLPSAPSPFRQESRSLIYHIAAVLFFLLLWVELSMEPQLGGFGYGGPLGDNHFTRFHARIAQTFINWLSGEMVYM
jgi:hypothetical protein